MGANEPSVRGTFLCNDRQFLQRLSLDASRDQLNTAHLHDFTTSLFVGFKKSEQPFGSWV